MIVLSLLLPDKRNKKFNHNYKLVQKWIYMYKCSFCQQNTCRLNIAIAVKAKIHNKAYNLLNVFLTSLGDSMAGVGGLGMGFSTLSNNLRGFGSTEEE